jgi:hypothetical protein
VGGGWWAGRRSIWEAVSQRKGPAPVGKSLPARRLGGEWRWLRGSTIAGFVRPNYRPADGLLTACWPRRIHGDCTTSRSRSFPQERQRYGIAIGAAQGVSKPSDTQSTTRRIDSLSVKLSAHPFGDNTLTNLYRTALWQLRADLLTPVPQPPTPLPEIFL